jgi:hypothetical protein
MQKTTIVSVGLIGVVVAGGFVARSACADEPQSMPLSQPGDAPYSPFLAVSVPLLATVAMSAAGIAMSTGNPGKARVVTGSSLAVAGLVLAPAIGDAYIGRWDRAALFSGARLGALAAAFVGGYYVVASALCEGAGCSKKSDSSAGKFLLLPLGVIGLLVLDVVEPVSTWGAAKERNQKAGIQPVALAPLVAPDPSGHGTVGGLVLTGMF